MANLQQISRSFAQSNWGLKSAAGARAARIEAAWRVPLMMALLATIPAFYAELLPEGRQQVAGLVYLVAGLTAATALLHTALRCPAPVLHLRANVVDGLLALGLLLAAVLPASMGSQFSLGLRLGVAFLVLLRLVWTLRRLITRGSLAYLLLISVGVLGLCGAGFWWLEPTVNSLGDGLWLAFTTAATVGYGDLTPTSPASRIFAVFVVLLGYGVLSTVTAAIAAAWVETEERNIEHEILRDLRKQVGSLRHEIAALRAQLRDDADADGTRASPPPPPPDEIDGA